MRTSSKEVWQLDAAWRQLLAPFAVPEPEVAAAFADLARRYSEEARHYHNLTHLHETLTVIDDLHELMRDAAAVRLAAWFHDAVYDSRAKDNEERSAELAAAVLTGLGLAQLLVAEVGRLILLTKAHRAGDDDCDGRVLLDADLAILGAEADRYDDYARAVRREYVWVAEDAYRDGRRRVLEAFLDRPRIFFTDRMFRSHETRARENLRRECAELGAEPDDDIPMNPAAPP
jgi:predicted metal-dependent HD superfamily phosphohydrolase